eukprot:jgi/Ulvmu1/10786/UM069_0020.1
MSSALISGCAAAAGVRKPISSVRCTTTVCRQSKHDGVANVTSAAPVDRRFLMLASASVAIAGVDSIALPALADTEKYKDPEDGFAVTVPASWNYAVPTEPYDRFRAGVSTKRTLAWFPDSGSDVNVTVVVTTPGADYTSLRSFGSAQDFGSNLVTSMDRSYLQKKGKPLTDEILIAKLVNTKTENSSYFVDYTVQRGTQPQRHLYSRVVLGFNGRFRRLYTITAQCPDSASRDTKDTLQAIVSSLKVERPTAV